MTTSLWALGAVFAILLAGIVVVAVYLRGRWRRLVRDLEELDNTVTRPYIPSRVELEELDEFEWSDPESVQRAIRELNSRGFERIGDFAITGMRDLRLQALCNPVERLYAMVCDSRSKGSWTDLLVSYESGAELVVSNRPHAGMLDRPPEMGLRVESGASASRLVDSILAHRGTGPFSLAMPDGFTRRYADSHARYMDWRNRRGGPTLEEVRRVASASGEEHDEESIRATYELERQQFSRKLDEECLQMYLQQGAIPESESGEHREEIVVIHEFSIPDVVFERCAELLPADEGIQFPNNGVGTQARAAFEAWNARLPADRRFRKVGEIWSPVHAVVYRLALETV